MTDRCFAKNERSLPDVIHGTPKTNDILARLRYVRQKDERMMSHTAPRHALFVLSGAEKVKSQGSFPLGNLESPHSDTSRKG